ncbi:MAG: hypothetical protein ACREQ5_10865, partial [Candidatus Dormibacteria bacterium]
STMENQKLQRLAQQERMKTEEMRANQQADYQNARLAQFDNAQKAADQRRQDQERDTHLKQNNLLVKQKSALQKLTVPNMTRLAEANSLLRADPFFDNYSDDQFKSASSMIAARAGAILGQKFDPSKTSDNWQPSDMDEAMREAVEEAKNDGKLTQIKKPSWLESILSGGTAQQTGGVSTQTASGKVTQSTVNNKVPLSKITPSKDPASYSGPLSVKKAYENGALSYDEAASILKKRGWAK